MVALKIPIEAVESSNLAGIGYDADKKILAVAFKNGAIFHYAGVPLEVVTEFYAALSKGAFYGLNIKKKFSGQKMTGTCPTCSHAPGWIGEPCADCATADYADDRQLAKASDSDSRR